jgi:hypothetical protein
MEGGWTPLSGARVSHQGLARAAEPRDESPAAGATDQAVARVIQPSSPATSGSTVHCEALTQGIA